MEEHFTVFRIRGVGKDSAGRITEGFACTISEPSGPIDRGRLRDELGPVLSTVPGYDLHEAYDVHAWGALGTGLELGMLYAVGSSVVGAALWDAAKRALGALAPRQRLTSDEAARAVRAALAYALDCKESKIKLVELTAQDDGYGGVAKTPAGRLCFKVDGLAGVTFQREDR